MAEFFNEHITLIAQAFGFCAMAVGIITFQTNKRKRILTYMIVGCVLWCIHFSLLGHWTAVAMNGLNVVRNIVFCFRDKKWGKSNVIPVLFIAASLVLTIVTYDDLWSLLPFFASIFAIISTWQTNTKVLRFMTIPINISWFTYNITHNSWAGAANECFVFVSIIVAIIRYDILKKEEKKA